MFERPSGAQPGSMPGRTPGGTRRNGSRPWRGRSSGAAASVEADRGVGRPGGQSRLRRPSRGAPLPQTPGGDPPPGGAGPRPLWRRPGDAAPRSPATGISASPIAAAGRSRPHRLRHHLRRRCYHRPRRRPPQHQPSLPRHPRRPLRSRHGNRALASCGRAERPLAGEAVAAGPASQQGARPPPAPPAGALAAATRLASGWLAPPCRCSARAARAGRLIGRGISWRSSRLRRRPEPRPHRRICAQRLGPRRATTSSHPRALGRRRRPSAPSRDEEAGLSAFAPERSPSRPCPARRA